MDEPEGPLQRSNEAGALPGALNETGYPPMHDTAALFVIPFVTVVDGPTIVECVLSMPDGSTLASLNFSIPDPVPDSMEG